MKLLKAAFSGLAVVALAGCSSTPNWDDTRANAERECIEEGVGVSGRSSDELLNQMELERKSEEVEESGNVVAFYMFDFRFDSTEHWQCASNILPNGEPTVAFKAADEF